MKLGIVGLGKMGANMSKRLLERGHDVVVTDLSREVINDLVSVGAIPADNLSAMLVELDAPRVLWLMVPAGEPTEQLVQQALPLLNEVDILVDGANSNWQDSLRRAKKAAKQGVHYVDAGVSGGVWGLEAGYNLMVGGSEQAVKQIEPVLKSLAAAGGYAHVGPAGSGHFVKMIHNGIEYGLMQAYGEGFAALASFEHAELDLEQIAKLWTNGSVVRSWLLELTVNALAEDARLENIKGYVEDSGMGRWTLEYGINHAVPMPALAAALYARFASRQDESFAAKLAAALRNQFGGHHVEKKS